MAKSPDAFRTISEVSDWLDTPAHVLRFWESKFSQVKPVKRAGGRRYYRPEDMALLGGIKTLLHEQGMTIKGVQKLLREQGARQVAAYGPIPLEEGGTELLAAALSDFVEPETVDAGTDTDLFGPKPEPITLTRAQVKATKPVRPTPAPVVPSSEPTSAPRLFPDLQQFPDPVLSTVPDPAPVATPWSKAPPASLSGPTAIPAAPSDRADQSPDHPVTSGPLSRVMMADPAVIRSRRARIGPLVQRLQHLQERLIRDAR